jgi:hypothetical protein
MTHPAVLDCVRASGPGLVLGVRAVFLGGPERVHRTLFVWGCALRRLCANRVVGTFQLRCVGAHGWFGVYAPLADWAGGGARGVGVAGACFVDVDEC